MTLFIEFTAETAFANKLSPLTKLVFVAQGYVASSCQADPTDPTVEPMKPCCVRCSGCPRLDVLLATPTDLRSASTDSAVIEPRQIFSETELKLNTYLLFSTTDSGRT